MKLETGRVRIALQFLNPGGDGQASGGLGWDEGRPRRRMGGRRESYGGRRWRWLGEMDARRRERELGRLAGTGRKPAVLETAGVSGGGVKLETLMPRRSWNISDFRYCCKRHVESLLLPAIIGYFTLPRHYQSSHSSPRKLTSNKNYSFKQKDPCLETPLAI